jgi:hypothetical protein
MIRPFISSLGDIDGADGHLRGVGSGVALDRDGQDLAGLLLAALADGGLILQDQAAHLASEVLLDALQEQVARLVGGKAADPLQGLDLVGEDPLDLGAPLPQFVLLLGQVALPDLEFAFLDVDDVELLVEQVGAFLQPLLLGAQVAAQGVGLGVEGFAAAEGLFLGVEVRLAADGLRLAVGVGDDLLGVPARGPSLQPRAEEHRGDPDEGACEESDQLTHGNPVHLAARAFPRSEPQRLRTTQAPRSRQTRPRGLTQAPGQAGATAGSGARPMRLSESSPGGRTKEGGHARRQRLRRAFPGLAAGGEVARSGGKVARSDPHRRDSSLHIRGGSLVARGYHPQIGSNTAILVLAGAASDSPRNSGTEKGSSRNPAGPAGGPGAGRAPEPPSGRPA